MTLQNGERQVAPTIEGIRRDHVARYEWAAQRLQGRVIDLACGVGYGTAILAKSGCVALGFDRDPEAIAYARKHYADGGATFKCQEAARVDPGPADAAVCFETIEHLKHPEPVLRKLHELAPRLLASVPNEAVFPHQGRVLFHYRHYTRGQFWALLSACGWKVTEWWGQAGPESEVERNCEGRTLIAVCERLPVESGATDAGAPVVDIAANADRLQRDTAASEAAAATDSVPVPEHVAILGLGPSLEQYVNIVKRLGGKHAFCDETWGINATGGVLQCDRVFHMDDVRIQEIRAKAEPDSNIARMLEWIKVHPGPIVTSRAHPDYPGLVEFPLEAVLNKFQAAYFNSTAAYAVAYAIWLGVKKISLFGVDFTYANSHDAEKGRACVEFWLGIASANGVRLSISKSSSLLDAITTPAEKFYGYDTVDVEIEVRPDGSAKVGFKEKAVLPTAEEIEARYDHSRHPNVLVEQRGD